MVACSSGCFVGFFVVSSFVAICHGMVFGFYDIRVHRQNEESTRNTGNSERAYDSPTQMTTNRDSLDTTSRTSSETEQSAIGPAENVEVDNIEEPPPAYLVPYSYPPAYEENERPGHNTTSSSSVSRSH